jgi:hypothetical protein
LRREREDDLTPVVVTRVVLPHEQPRLYVVACTEDREEWSYLRYWPDPAGSYHVSVDVDRVPADDGGPQRCYDNAMADVAVASALH